MKTYDDIVSRMPVGLERSVGRILSRCIGKENSIEREELLELVRSQVGLAAAEDRQMRMAIQKLRNKGIRVCHDEQRVRNEKDGKTRVKFGYYLAATDQEYLDFRQRYGSYAASIWQTIRSMDEKREVLTAEGTVEPPPGTEIQTSLFAGGS